MIEVDLTPEQYADDASVRRAVARQAGVSPAALGDLHVVRRTLDCRRRTPIYHITLSVEPAAPLPTPDDSPRPPLRADVVIVGAGPAGLFAALRALELGLRPIVVERGKDVDSRRRDIATLARQKRVDADSNWCFGEGGAGTFSDGKLYTRSTKRGDVGAVLRHLVAHGADPDILLDAHAHIGTDRLGGIMSRIRRTIEASGGEYHFGQRVVSLIVREGRACGVATHDGQHIEGCAVILATGHSARDIYQLLLAGGLRLEAKPFALGVRVEHPQRLIDDIQYHGHDHSPLLPPASYSLTTQACGHGVFSFCMCPGGVIVPAATAEGQQVVNGMSNSLRNSPWANSGIAVTVGLADVAESDPLSLLRFQQAVEARAFEAGSDAINAPSQRLVDFMRSRLSSSLPRSGYLGDTVSAPLHEVLPPFVVASLQQAFRDFDRKMHGFVCADALLLAVESRTSSPVRIPRDPTTLQHPQLPGLYPCGEGAGYAGGITSSAIDGIRCIESLAATVPQRGGA